MAKSGTVTACLVLIYTTVAKAVHSENDDFKAEGTEQAWFDSMQRSTGQETQRNANLGIDLYSALAIFSFAVFIGYLLYNYLTRRTSTGRILPLPLLDAHWFDGLPSLYDFDWESGSHFTARVLTSLDRWRGVVNDLPEDPSMKDFVEMLRQNV